MAKFTGSETYAVYLMNDMLIELFGLPKKYRGKKHTYRGHFSLLFKWIRKDKHEIKYIWFVVTSVYQKFKHSGAKVTPGYFNNAFKFYEKKYNPDEVYLPYSASREEMLAVGHTIDTLPFHLLTKEERAAQDDEVEVDITDEDRESFRKFLEGI